MTQEYIVFVFDNQADTEGTWHKAAAAANIGKLTDEQFSVFKDEFKKAYNGYYFPVFMPKESIPAEEQLRLKMLLAREKLSEGRRKPLNMSIKFANDIRTKDEERTQEYFLSYYKPVYPPCRSVLDNDTDGIELQREKPCFQSHYTPENTEYGTQCVHRFGCNWSECRYCQCECIARPCPEQQQKVLTYRCEIGKLTDEEKDLLLKRTGILQEKCFDLSPLAIDALTLEERLEHKEALKRFWSHVTYHTPQNGDDYFTVNFIDFYGDTAPLETMTACLNTAYSIMAELHKTNPEPAVNRQMPIKPPIKPNEWADKPADVNVINKELTVDFGDKSRAILKEILHEVITESKDMAEKTTTTAVFNALKRVQDDDETALEKIHRLQQIPGMTWKMIAQEVSPDIAEENIESEGERLRKQHERAYSPAERKQRKKRKS